MFVSSLRNSICTTTRCLRQQTQQQLQPRRTVHVERTIDSLGITLPKAAAPRANYNIVCHAQGNMLYVSGHLPFQADGTLMTGKIDGKERDVDYGYQAARWAGLNIVATLKDQLGDLDRIEKIVKVFGIVQSTDDFKSQHLVMDGCSDVMMEIFGKEVGYHARSAIGTSTLPLDISVEIEAVVQLKDN
jgi:enamine deaminase RidA (YjgF/YER057c/UK114 family)